MNIWLIRLKALGTQFWDGICFWVYPESCLICSAQLPSHVSFVCAACRSDLPFTFFENSLEPTPLDKLFWGRVTLESSFALLKFEQNSATQKLLHELKYKNKPQLGVLLGEIISSRLNNNLSVDFLVPIPLHPKKQYQRGYNQSEQLAIGLGERWGVAVNSTALLRGVNAESQTKQGRFGRWGNVAEAFSCKDVTMLENKHIALIDDVTTTGATLEACVKLLQKEIKGVKISVICLAITV
jgi:competence protein ComFC